MTTTTEANTIDMTPTWSGLLPALLAIIADGSSEGQKAAREELARMAQAADQWNAHCKGGDATLDKFRDALSGLLEMSDAVSEHVPGAGWRMAQHTARNLMAEHPKAEPAKESAA